MLKPEDNELLTQVGPGTPMGEVMRRYWHPVLLSQELPDRDGQPLRVRLLGEDLVAFRETSGRVGLLGARCPHRRAPLVYGRNEEGGLRCVYHGWKFDVTGACVDMPNEPPKSRFKEKIRQPAYTCVEQGGVIWAYLGGDEPPPLPRFEWTDLPGEHRYMSKRLNYCNWMQTLEGEIDQSHTSFLHRRIGEPISKVERLKLADTHPRFETVDTDSGVLIGAGREAGDGQVYWRITNYLTPYWSMVGPYGPDPIRKMRAIVPIDDEHNVMIALVFHPLRPLTDAELTGLRAGSDHPEGGGFVGDDHYLPAVGTPAGAWRPKARQENDFLWSREVQQTRFYSGFPDIWAQDGAVQEGMGPICDRSEEHLGTSDLGIIRVRRRLIRAARALRDHGDLPPGARDPDAYSVRAAAVMLSKEQSWVEATADQRKVVPGVNPAGL